MSNKIVNEMLAENLKKQAACQKRADQYAKLNCPAVAQKHQLKANSYNRVIEILKAKLVQE